MTNHKNPLVFGYVRVSTENQLENYSIEEQVQRIEAYCKAKGWTLLKTYTDGGYSGGNIDRPALQQMLKAIREGKADAVVVYKLDRLSRSQKDTLTLIEDEFLTHDTDFISINENFDTSTPFGRAMIGILSVFAQLEKDQITERFTMGRIARGKAGYFHGGGNAPFGYRYEEGELIVQEAQAVMVREIYDRFLTGASINAIQRRMQSCYGGSWSATKIRNILTNSLYTGKVKFAGQEYEGKHQPILSPETFESVQALLHSAQRTDAFTTSQKTPFRAGYLLSSLIYCKWCGARYSGNHGFYKCYSRAKSSRKFIVDPDCKNENWPIQELDHSVVGEIRKLTTNGTFFDQVTSRAGTKKEPTVDRKAIEGRLSALDNQMNKLIELYQVSAIPMETVTAKVTALRTEQAILQGQLDTASGQSEDAIETFRENAARFAKEFDTAPLETQRLLVSSLIEKIIVDGQDFIIQWRI